MGPKKNADLWKPQEGPHPCFFKCGRSLRSKWSRIESERWEWFTGYGIEPIHFCPQCKRTRQPEIDLIRAHMEKRPEGYPDKRVDPPSR